MRPDRPFGDPRLRLIALLKQRAAGAGTSPAVADREPQWVLAPRLALGGILLLAAALRCWNLGAGGVLVPYYFAAARSMAASWHNFFFNAFDPAGFVSLDKPPVAFWLQALSVRLFGFSTQSVLLPQVIEGLGAIFVLYGLVRRQFGTPAALLAALLLALSPVNVAVDRSNNTESALILVLLLAVWAFFKAVETARTRWLIAAAILIGVGFNIKMLVALGIVPVLAATYLVCAAPSPPRRFGQLAAAAAALAIVSLSWCVAYDLTPAASRPFVDSSPGNSMLELVVGHNFVERFVRPERSAPDARPRAPRTAGPGPPFREFAPAGPLRLAMPPLAAQVGWLFPLALAGVALAWRAREVRPSLAVWGGWAAVYGIAFSAAGGFFHAYYLAVMAPPVCALSAIGVQRLWHLHRERRLAAVLPAALLTTALWQAYILDFYLSELPAPERDRALAGLVGAAALAGGGLCLHPVTRRVRLAAGIAAAGVAILLAAPAAWSLGTSLMVAQAGFPAARPPLLTAEAETRRARFNEIAGAIAADPQLLAFLAQNRGDERYLLATSNARLAAPVIIATGAPVMALGGFGGQVPTLAAADFAHLVETGRVRYALIGDGSPGLRRVFGEGRQRELSDWIRANGRPVERPRWRSPMIRYGGPPAESIGAELYDLRPPPPGG
jgi:4-amino-4-deoxy-L-arabinose transferase-like glycosyltransferase